MAKSNRGGALQAQRLRAEETRGRLLASGRALFAEFGYVSTGINAIVAHAGTTRGAFYHHFADKPALFEQIFHDTANALNDRATQAAAGSSPDRWGRVVAAYQAYLQIIAADPACQRILLIDGPAVLGWSRWRRLHSDHVAIRTAQALELLMHDGIVAQRPVAPLANLIQAALNDAALTIADGADGTISTAESIDAFLFVLEGIRISR